VAAETVSCTVASRKVSSKSGSVVPVRTNVTSPPAWDTSTVAMWAAKASTLMAKLPEATWQPSVTQTS